MLTGSRLLWYLKTNTQGPKDSRLFIKNKCTFLPALNISLKKMLTQITPQNYSKSLQLQLTPLHFKRDAVNTTGLAAFIRSGRNRTTLHYTWQSLWEKVLKKYWESHEVEV